MYKVNEMKSIIIIIACFLIITADVRSMLYANSTSDSLRLLHILFRHGERTPTETYTNDPYKEYKWPGGWGQLNKKGKLEMYNLGVELREQYSSFLPEYYFPEDIDVRSSYSHRCLMSADLLLAGLFPPYKEQIWNSELLWQPIPVNYLPRSLDNIIVMRMKCPAYDHALQEAYLTYKMTKINDENSNLYKYLSNNTGDKINNITAVEFLYNTLEIERLHNLTLPEWTNTVYPEPLKTTAAQSLAIFTDTDFMKKMKGGVLLKDIVTHMMRKKDNTHKPNRLLYLYSGHDVTIVNFMRTLGFTKLLKPGFGASVTIELHFVNEIYEVKLFYKDTPASDNVELHLDFCKIPCTLDNFVTGLHTMMPSDWKKECNEDFVQN